MRSACFDGAGGRSSSSSITWTRTTPTRPGPPFDKVDGPDIPYHKSLRQTDWQELSGRYVATRKGLTPELLRSAVNQYDGEVAYTDHWIGGLLDSLREKGLYDDALIIVTSDHGEFFGEHEYLDHSVALYEEGVRIPLMVKYPKGAHAGETKSTRVSIIDVFATVLDTVGAPMPDVPAEPLDTASRPVMLENHKSGLQSRRYPDRANRTLTALFDGNYKYMKSTNGPSELYDLAADPREATNLAVQRPDVAARLDGELSRWLSENPLFDASTEVNLAPSGGGLGRSVSGSGAD